jgi:NAD(P)-dependent dehydrogenase (short-subunit alcohol dehydrogenase family)
LPDSENHAPPLGAAARRFDLSDRVVVVTRASKGIGRELTILLAETGAVVVPTVRTDADAVAVTTEAQCRGLTVHPQLLDVRDVTSINEAVSRILAAHGGIDVLVNNASLDFARAAFDVTEADWDEMMAIVPCQARHDATCSAASLVRPRRRLVTNLCRSGAK